MYTLENSQAWYPVLWYPDTVATKHITPDLASLSISGDSKEAKDIYGDSVDYNYCQPYTCSIWGPAFGIPNMP
jgi:hypothetical protein